MASTCQACPAGTFSTANGGSACEDCAPGLWSPDNASSCILCARGEFSLGRASVCSACSTGSASNEEGVDRCMPCIAGTHAPETGALECQPCLAGRFSLWGASVCTSCLAGTFAQLDRATRCLDCAVGLWAYTEATACVNCEPGKYSVTERAGDPSNCLDCPEGYYSNATAATSPSTCQRCGVGVHSPAGGSVCTACPSNSYTGFLGPGCLACPPWSTSAPGSSLEQCVCDGGRLRIWDRDMRGFTCIQCSAGTYTTQNNASTCISCAPGKFAAFGAALGVLGVETDACSACAAGYFSTASGQTHCEPCALGLYAGTSGQSTCVLCPIGFFASTIGTSTCPECLPGKYSATAGASACSNCGPGTFTNTSQSIGCRNCSMGSFNEQAGATRCLLCGAGTYSSILGLANESHCQKCRTGSFSTSIGATTRQVCQRCPTGLTTAPGGSACFPCPAGQFPNEMYGACSACPKHSILNLSVSSPEECRCGPGHFLGYNAKALGGEESYDLGRNGLVYKAHTFHRYDEGILVVAEAAVAVTCNGLQKAPASLWRPDYYPPVASASTCPLPMVMSYPVDIVFDEDETSTHVQCVPCPRGTFSVLGGTEDDCILCPSGQFQGQSGASSCSGCPPGTYAFDGGDACIPCQPGTYQVGNGCVPCQDGHFTLGIGATACIPCPNNMWSNNISGGCRNCPLEATSIGGTNVTGCLCAEGHFLFVFRNTPYCVQCEIGKYAADRSNRCVPCPPGTFGNLTGMHACFGCQDNPVHVSSRGASTCTTCGPGTTPAQDRGGCVPCPVGKYCTGNSSTQDCPLGSFMTTGNITSLQGCQRCPRDFFCASPTTRQACPTGTYSEAGSINKHDCKCLDQFNCIYWTITTKKITLDIPPDEFESRRAEFIAALAAAWGVSTDSINIISVQPSTQALRRALGSRQTLVMVSVSFKGGQDTPDIDDATRQALHTRGMHALSIGTFNQSLDF